MTKVTVTKIPTKIEERLAEALRLNSEYLTEIGRLTEKVSSLGDSLQKMKATIPGQRLEGCAFCLDVVLQDPSKCTNCFPEGIHNDTVY